MLKFFKAHRPATVIVLFSGMVFSVMVQLNWLYLVKNENFEKNETIRLILSPLGTIIIFLLWMQFVTLLKKSLDAEILDKIVFKDSLSMLALLGSLHALWSPPLNYFTFRGTLLAWFFIKLILYPKELVIVCRNSYQILFKNNKVNNPSIQKTSVEGDYQRYILGTCIFLSATIGFLWLTVNKIPPQTDEGVHFEQILIFLNGEFTRHSAVTMFPGYHLITSIVLYIFQLDSFTSARFFSLLMALTSVYVFYQCVTILHPSIAVQRTLSFFALPILFPFQFLVYTHSVSVLFILIGIYYYLKRRLNLCAVILGISVLIRQTNVMWIVMIFMVEYINRNGLFFDKKRIIEHINKYILFFFIIIDFVFFVIGNGGRVSLATDHLLTVRTENIYFSLFVFFFLFLPFILSNIHNAFQYFSRRIYLIIPFVIIFVFYVYEFDVVHKYNQIGIDHWIHNMIPHFIVNNIVNKIISFIPIIIAVISLLSFRLYSKSIRVFYLIWVLSLIPLTMIEMRYYIPHMTLFLILKKPEKYRNEWYQSFYLIGISIVVVYLFIEYNIFL